MTWAEVVEFAKTRPRDEAFALIDEQVAKRPDLADAANLVKAFLEPLYAAPALDESIASATAEIWNLLQTGRGPVSNAPEIGLA